MKNKFLEYFLQEKLKDITYNIREIPTEREKRFSNQEEEYPYIDDMFQFFFELDVSQEELFHAIRKEKASYSLADMLVGAETQNDKNKEKKIEIFKPLIEENINFFKQVMQIFLSEHGYIREEFIEKNLKIFEKILDIGLKKGYFQYFSEKEIQTQKKEYKKLLIEKGIFNTNYDLQETISILSKKEQEISNHFSMYSESIHKELENIDSDKFQKILESLRKIVKVDKQQEDVEIKNKFNDFLYYLLKTEKEGFLPLLKNSIIRQNIIFIDRYSNNALNELVNHPFLLEELFSNAQDDEKFKLLKKEKYTAGLLISLLTEKARDKIYMNEKLLNIILENIDKYVSDNNVEENNKEIVMTHIIFNQTPKLTDKTVVNKIFEKYTKTIVKALTEHDKNENYFKYETRLMKFNELEKVLDSTIYNKIKSKLEIAQKDMLYKFSQSFKTSYGSIEYKDKKTLESLVQYLNITKDISVLNVLNADPENPEWKKINFSHSIDKKYHENDNILIYLLREVKKDEVKLSIVDWIMEENINNFYELKYDNKDILSYYKKESDKTKNKESVFIKVVNKILDKEHLFDKLLKNNKVKLKLIQAIEDQEIQKKLNYHLLRDKLKTETKEIKIKQKTNKI